MRLDAIEVILEKAWNTNSSVTIYINCSDAITIHPSLNKWKIHGTLNVLCVGNNNEEIFIDADKIYSIYLVKNED